MKRALFLDRDGVLDELVHYADTDSYGAPRAPEDLRLLPGVRQALETASKDGWLIFVVSNQPDAAKGRTTREALHAVHEELLRRLGGPLIAAVYYCDHRAEDACACRKPSPFFVLEAAKQFGVDLGQSWFVGDSDADIECGRRAGCKTALIEYEHSSPRRGAQRPDQVFRDLGHFVRALGGKPSAMALNLNIELYADGADVRDMVAARDSGLVKGFTTNPTLMRKSGITDYEAFAHEALAAVGGLPISFEVFADEFGEMERQAKLIATWGESVFVKIPITNTRRESSIDLIGRLSAAGVKLNITAILTLDQVRQVVDAVDANVPAIVSVFAGRIADTGRDPVPIMTAAAAMVRRKPKAQLLWASPRELLNIFHADACGCHIITVTSDILKKLSMVGKSLDDLSLDTVKMFFNDAGAAGFRL